MDWKRIWENLMGNSCKNHYQSLRRFEEGEGRTMKQITFYTDGACSGNPGEGGWAYVEVIPCDSGIKTNVVSGNKKQTHMQESLQKSCLRCVQTEESKQSRNSPQMLM